MRKIKDEKSNIYEAYGFIYITTNLINGKRYIGQCSFHDRWVNYLGSGKLILQAIKKYGRENFKRDILYIGQSADELDIMEEFFIISYNADISKDYYNIISGSSGSSNNFFGKSEEEMKEIGMKISEKNKGLLVGEKNPMFGTNVNKGIKRSDEFKKKVSENHADFSGGKNGRAKKVCITDSNNKVIKIFDCINELKEYVKTDIDGLSVNRALKCLRQGLHFNDIYIKYYEE